MSEYQKENEELLKKFRDFIKDSGSTELCEIWGRMRQLKERDRIHGVNRRIDSKLAASAYSAALKTDATSRLMEWDADSPEEQLSDYLDHFSEPFSMKVQRAIEIQPCWRVWIGEADWIDFDSEKEANDFLSSGDSTDE